MQIKDVFVEESGEIIFLSQDPTDTIGVRV